MSKTLEIKEENVKKAYDEACPEAKKILKSLFPGTFSNEFNIGVGKVWEVIHLKDYRHVIMAVKSGDNQLDLISLNNGNLFTVRYEHSSLSDPSKFEIKRSADSLKEYLDNGGKL